VFHSGHSIGGSATRSRGITRLRLKWVREFCQVEPRVGRVPPDQAQMGVGLVGSFFVEVLAQPVHGVHVVRDRHRVISS